MKVNLAAQSLGSSVADAIDFCRDDLQLDDFKGSEAMVQFICLFDRLFDTRGSHNPFGKGYKAPLKGSNHEFWSKFWQMLVHTYVSKRYCIKYWIKTLNSKASMTFNVKTKILHG